MCRPTLQSSSLLLSAGLTFATSSGLNEGSGEFGHTSPTARFFHAALARVAEHCKKTNVAFVSAQVQNNHMSTDQESKIAEDGLRYKRKESGSPFQNIGSMATISCYKCGLHKPRALGMFKKLINQQMFMCGDCMPSKSA